LEIALRLLGCIIKVSNREGIDLVKNNSVVKRLIYPPVSTKIIENYRELCFRNKSFPMNPEKKYVASMLFRSDVIRKTGQAFEDLFCEVMLCKYPDFQKVKPQGNLGDRKNDGYVPSESIFFQIYSPERPTERVSKAIKKLNEDFHGLYSYWNKIHPIKTFFFVFNDNYSGTYPEFEKTIAQLRRQYQEIQMGFYFVNQLEDTFMDLEEYQMLRILGGIPDPENLDPIKYEPLDYIIKHLMQLPSCDLRLPIGEAPDFDDKIQFNNLGKQAAAYLQSGSFQSSEIRDYFKTNSTYQRQQVAIKMAELYSDGLVQYPDKADEVFFHILAEIVPDSQRQVKNEALILMAYYFEHCDIFEEPPDDFAG
jgi:hypothetical protein